MTVAARLFGFGTILLLAVGISSQARADSTDIYLAGGTEGLNPFWGVVRDGAIIAVPEPGATMLRNELLERFPIGQALDAVAANGEHKALTVSGHTAGAGYYESAISTDPPVHELMLASKRSARLRALALRLTTLPRSLVMDVNGKARRIWHEEIARIAPEDRPKDEINLGPPRAYRVPRSASAKVVVIPARYTNSGGEDDSRGSFFFLVDSATGAISYSRFGHPEWSPNASRSVAQILPAFFFVIGADPRVYLLATHHWGWESSGLAIVDPLRGKVLALTEPR